MMNPPAMTRRPRAMWIVRLALRRPYTFVVMGVLIVVLDVFAIVTVPATTLVVGADGTKVVVVRDDRTVRYQAVELGRDLGRSVEIVSGLTGTERLVLNPPDGLKDGDRVVLAAAPR